MVVALYSGKDFWSKILTLIDSGATLKIGKGESPAAETSAEGRLADNPKLITMLWNRVNRTLPEKSGLLFPMVRTTNLSLLCHANADPGFQGNINR